VNAAFQAGLSLFCAGPVGTWPVGTWPVPISSLSKGPGADDRSNGWV